MGKHLFRTVKKYLKLNPWYVGLYIVVLGLLIASSYLEYKSRYRDVLRLIQDQAAMTAAVIAQSGSGQAYLTEALKQSYIDRALDILQILSQLDTEQAMSEAKLYALANDATIMDITIYDALGKVDQSVTTLSKTIDPKKQSDQTWVAKQLQPLLSQNQDLVIVGIDQEDFLSPAPKDANQQFLIAIPRDGGGAISCQLSLEAEEDFKFLTTMELALEDLLQVKGLQYLSLAVDDREPYYVSRTEDRVDGTWSRKALDDILYHVSKGERHLLEVVRPVFFNSSLGEVRIGFKADTLFSLQGQIIYQILVRTTLLTLLAFVLLIFLFARRNTVLLREEKIRIEAEVYRLEKLNRIREKQVAIGELAAGVAHEIRNPLNAIGIVAQRLKREFSTGEDQAEFVSLTGTMVSEISRINKSLQDFLEYTRPTPLNYSRLDAQEFLRGIHELYASEAKAKQVTLNLESSSLKFNADSEYLRQAVSNLVRNALDACRSGDEIHLGSAVNNNVIELSVSDTGMGIAPDQLNRVFDLYYTTKDMGTGVGLALTHKIIADHQGSIEVTSESGKGSKFEIKLPVNR